MVRARAILSVVALLVWANSGCLNPVTADAGAMDCCAGMDCSAGDGAHDCCQTMTAAPQSALAASITPVLPAPVAVFSGTLKQASFSAPARWPRQEFTVPPSHAPPLYTMHGVFLI